ncbi:MAG: hypothetical protein GY819_19680 [Planctomycetaceae bacterium]|nr:hypothetical protein [Planctomycetaceae bacterium]MCP4465019.1 hypothetical protein [Planctomycetaceae bacterium]
MSKIAITIGLLLILVGVAGYAMPATEMVAEGTEEIVEKKSSLTALIPAAFGIVILLCGAITAIKPSLTKTFMHVAVTFGLLGALAATGRGSGSLIKFIRGEEFNQRAFVFIACMGVLCWIFVVTCVMSFIKARKARVTNAGNSNA